MSASETFEEAVAWVKRDDGKVSDEHIAAQVEAAANAGHAQAARLSAVIAGAGFGRPQDWTAALTWLSRAAALGDADAQAQLELIGGSAGLAAWLTPQATRLVIEDPRVGVVDEFVDARVCQWLIERGAPLQQGALVYDSNAGRVHAQDARTNTAATFTLLSLDVPMLLLRARIAATMDVPAQNLERSAVFHYGVGQAFAPHTDFLDPAQWRRQIERSGQRTMTFLIYLNAEFEGGETHFVTLEKRLRGGVGGAVFFHNVDMEGAPDPRTLHEGAPPTSGEKWLFSQFIRNKPQLPG